MKVGETIQLKAAHKAESRTKNRIRENGPLFLVQATPQTTRFDRAGRLWVMLESLAMNASDGQGGKEHWKGWLPIDEIEKEIT